MSLQAKLIELNRLDLRVRGLRRRLDAGQRRHAVLQRKQAQLNQQFAELDTQHKQHKAKASEFEKQAAELASKQEKLREQMNTITNDKQYRAVLMEIDTLKKQSAELDEQTLERMTLAEEAKAKLDAIQAQLDEQKQLIANAEQEVDDAKGEVAGSLTEAENEMKAAARDIPRDVLIMYSKLSDENEGEAIGYVEELNRRRMEYTCSVSQIILPAEMVNSLITRPDVILTCPSSGVIMVMDPKLTEELAAAK